MGHIVEKPVVFAMKYLLMIALTGAATGSPSNRNDIEGAAAALTCTAETNVGNKLEEAFSICFGPHTTLRKEVKKMQFMRNEHQCYSYQDIMAWVEEEYADDACVLQSIGWMNNNFDFDEEVISSDVASLDPAVTGPLFAGHEECVAEVVDIVEDHECASAFTEEETNSLIDMAQKIARYECFLQLFEQMPVVAGSEKFGFGKLIVVEESISKCL